MKGIMKTLEAVITILMVLVIDVIMFSAPIVPPDFESINLQLRAFSSLQTLDANNELRYYVSQNDTMTITNKLSSLMPTNVNYLISVCSSTCIAPVINSTRILSVNYLISGDYSNFNPQQIVLYMWS